MSKQPFILFGAFVVLVGVMAYLAFSNEGSEEASAVPVEAADEEAQEVFADKCGACHTLAAGGTDGVVGPDLDEIIAVAPAPPADDSPEALAQANEDAYLLAYSRVINAVTCGLEGRMPAGILEGEGAEEVSAFVAAYAGQLAEDQGPLVPTEDRPTPPPEPCSPSGGSQSTGN